MTKLTFILLGFFILVTNQFTYASQFRSLSYEDIRDEEGAFGSSNLTDVMEIFSGGRNLDEYESSLLTQSNSLTNLKKLDLSDQYVVDDKFIEALVKNSTFSRIIFLNLSGTNITDKSVDLIVRSKILGSIRDLPQISGRYDCPSSVITIRAKNTKVTDNQMKTLFSFHIEYKPHKSYNAYPWEPVDHGVKIVEIEN